VVFCCPPLVHIRAWETVSSVLLQMGQSRSNVPSTPRARWRATCISGEGMERLGCDSGALRKDMLPGLAWLRRRA
jgi:hypothetical protein